MREAAPEKKRSWIDFLQRAIASMLRIMALGKRIAERERELEHKAEELEALTRRMDELIGMTAHELSTPLTAVIGNIELATFRLQQLESYIPSPSPEVIEEIRLIKQLLGRTERQTFLQHRLVNDLLDLVRSRSKRLKLDLEDCDLLLLIRDVVQEQFELVPKRVVHLHLPPVESIPIIADRNRVQQVMTNYLNNAYKYSAEESPVEVHVRIEGQHVRVDIQDQGVGLTSEEQEHIWDSFYRVEHVSDQQEQGGGLGLGLYICRMLIEQHRGKVGVQSAPGCGSTFWFTLPIIHNQ